MRMIIRYLPLVALLLCCFSLPVSAADPPPAPEWDGVLDRIYAHTWRGRAELDAELKKEEARIKQDLPAYMAAWDQRIAMPIVYTDPNRGEACAPLAYCAADLLNVRSLVLKLREKKQPSCRLPLRKTLSPWRRRGLLSSTRPASPTRAPPLPRRTVLRRRRRRDWHGC